MVKRSHNAIKINANKRPNIFSGQSNLKENIQDDLIVFNFKFLDVTQGQSFEEWEKENLLSKTFELFKNYSSQKMSSSFDERFKCYKNFPPEKKTEYKHPKHVPEDAVWSSMHLMGKECVIGHIYKNVFYVVFLDKDHRFYITELK
jgi:hypothetical protein